MPAAASNDVTTVLTPATAYAVLILFGVVMWIATTTFRRVRSEDASESFLVANRDQGVLFGGFSIAVSWIWAPALFLSVQKAYQEGLPGIFWFIAPNILCLVIFAFLAIRIRELLPRGYTFPEYIKRRFDSKTHVVYLVVFFMWQTAAITINCLAGGALVHLLSGVPYSVAVILIAAIALSYALFNGLKASVITDFIQMSLILVVVFWIVPWTYFAGGGASRIQVSGVSGQFGNIFDPWVAYSFGIACSLGLISGTIADQQFWQRAFAIKKRKVKSAFILGALSFGIVPIALAFLGFMAAHPAINAQLPNPDDAQMIGVQLVGLLLPSWAMVVFLAILIAGLASTLDSAMCAFSSMGSVDIYKTYFVPEASDAQILRTSRRFMVLMTVVGVGIALIPGIKILYIFLVYGSIVSGTLLPTILSLYWKKLNSNGVFWGILIGTGVSFPAAVYGNIYDNVHVVVASAVFPVLTSAIGCVLISLRQPADFDFSKRLS